jgi:hypothetical protein
MRINQTRHYYGISDIVNLDALKSGCIIDDSGYASIFYNQATVYDTVSGDDALTCNAKTHSHH